VTPADGNAQVFCEIWPDARADLLASWNNESESDESGWAIRLEEEIARYDRIVPAAMRADWDKAHAVFTDIADLRFTVGYYDSRIRPEHLTMVFGEAGPQAAIAAAESAIDSPAAAHNLVPALTSGEGYAVLEFHLSDRRLEDAYLDLIGARDGE
jgi:hypothetical protein